MSEAIIGVIEFGSTARNDADQYSDKDILAVVEDVDADVLDTLRGILAVRYTTTPTSVACYSVSSFDQMIAHGSLFTWHLRLEGKILSDPYSLFTEAFANLAPYNAFVTDLERFREIFSDVCDAYMASNILDTFEEHVLFVIARNICMLLTARRGQPTFGRRTVILRATELYPEVPLSTSVAEHLASGHLTYMRNTQSNVSWTEKVEPDRALREVGLLLDFAARVLQ